MGNSENKFINHFSIDIGQDAYRAFPPMIMFRINEHFVTAPLKDMKDWINEIWDSQGNQNPKAIQAKINFDQFFAELLHPFIDYSYHYREKIND